MALGNGGDGETIAFHTNGLLYHSSGNSTAMFESVDVTTNAVTPLGTASGEMFAMGQSPEDVKRAATDVLDRSIATGGGIAEAIQRAFYA